MNNGHSSGYFKVNSGSRQGDPISAFLFILVLEIIFIQVKSNHRIEGVRILVMKSRYLLLLMMLFIFLQI